MKTDLSDYNECNNTRVVTARIETALTKREHMPVEIKQMTS